MEEVSRGEEYDIIINDASVTGANPHAIPLGDTVRFYDHGELCQVVSHEFSHHFALPDRYLRKVDGRYCTDQVVYKPETLMALSKKGGFLGYSALTFHEHDLEDMFYNICTKTINHFKKNPEMSCVENYDFLSIGDSEERENLTGTILDILSKFF